MPAVVRRVYGVLVDDPHTNDTAFFNDRIIQCLTDISTSDVNKHCLLQLPTPPLILRAVDVRFRRVSKTRTLVSRRNVPLPSFPYILPAVLRFKIRCHQHHAVNDVAMS